MESEDFIICGIEGAWTEYEVPCPNCGNLLPFEVDLEQAYYFEDKVGYVPNHLECLCGAEFVPHFQSRLTVGLTPLSKKSFIEILKS